MLAATTHRQVGNAGNAALLQSTGVTSTALLYQLPAKSYFDTGWLQNGFCVGNNESVWLNSHALSCYVDLFFAAVILGMYTTYKGKLSALGRAFALGSVFSMAGHGLGHFHYGTDPGGMDLRFSSDRVGESLVNTLVMLFTYGTIFSGTMPLASKKRVSATAAVCSAFHNILSIPPTLTFVYAQAAIYICTSLHMLSLAKQHKEDIIYMVYGLFQLPVVGVGLLEATQCEAFLKAIGGHAVYDGMIGLMIIAIVSLGVRNDNAKTNAKAKAN